MFNSQPPGAARVPSRVMPPPTIFSLGQTCSHSAGFSHFALWAFLGHWGAGRVVVGSRSRCVERSRGGGERRRREEGGEETGRGGGQRRRRGGGQGREREEEE